MRQLKLLVADDHRLMLAAIRQALAGAPDIEIVGTVESGSQVLPLVGQTKPDVVLLDILMPGMDGLRCLELLRQRHPEIKAVVLSAAEDADVIDAAFRKGAAGYIHKQVDPGDLASAIRQAVEGNVFQWGAAAAARSEREAVKKLGLTERELSILEHLGAGRSNKEIAKALWLAEQTVKFHLTNIYRKLDVTSRAEALRSVYEHGLVANPVLERPVAPAA
jgi:DNA-binding NarL/FixJ family response regulator